MSAPKPSPNVFVVVGETDHYDLTVPLAERNVEMIVDARLRTVRREIGASTPGVFHGRKRVRVLSRPVYIEWHYDAVSNHRFGVSRASRVPTSGQFMGAAGSVGVVTSTSLAGTHIQMDGVNVQSSVGVWASGDRVGLKLYRSGADVLAQYYRNGVVYGTPVVLAWADEGVKAGISAPAITGFSTLTCDADDMRFLPPDCDPWGAAARVADFGGYSPAASLLVQSAASITLDPYRRAATSTLGGHSARTDAVVAASRRLVYVEFIPEVAGADEWFIGFVAESTNLNNSVGVESTGWGYRGDGRKWNNNTPVSGFPTYGVGDRPGAILEPATRKVWFTKNGAPIEGNPQTSTGQSYIATTALLCAAMTPRNGGRIRICTHAREQLHRPSYAEAWDGADILPEQHFAGRLDGLPRLVREVSFKQWGARGGRSVSGSVDIGNSDGAYDALGDYSLRNGVVIGYRANRDSTQREFTCVAERVDVSQRSARVLIAPVDAQLEVRTPAEMQALGRLQTLPVDPVPDVASTYRWAGSPWISGSAIQMSIRDRGLVIPSWRSVSTDEEARFIRTVGVDGKQAVSDATVYAAIRQVPLTNNDFSSWSGGAPTGWTVSVTGSSTVTQAGSTAVMTGAGSAGSRARLWQGVTLEVGKMYGVKVHLTAYAASADVLNPTLQLSAAVGGSGTSVALRATGMPGTYYGVFEGSVANGIHISAAVGESFTLNRIELWEVADTRTTLGIAQAVCSLVDLPLQASSPTLYPVGQVGIRGDNYATLRQYLVAALSDHLADYFVDADGRVNVVWLEPPEELINTAKYAGELRDEECKGELIAKDDVAPALSNRTYWARNYAPHTESDLVSSIVSPIRERLMMPGRILSLVLNSTHETAAQPMHPFYAHAMHAEPMMTSVYNASNNHQAIPSVTTDATLHRLHRFYAKKRRFITWQVSSERARSMGLVPGRVIKRTSRRFGLWSRECPYVLNSAAVSSAGLAFDTFQRIVWGAADASWRTVLSRVGNAQGKFRYFEVLIADPGSSMHVGVHMGGVAVDAFAGASANSWGYRVQSDQLWHANGSTGSAGGVSGAGARVGVLWDGAKVWFLRNGVVLGGGAPQLGTGAHFQNVGGVLHAAVSLLGPTPGSAMLSVHAESQVFRPPYADPWDEAGLPLLIIRTEAVGEDEIQVTGVG